MMDEKNALLPTILVDFKKNRIRIHKQTAHIMADPDYFRFLVNPVDGVIALQVCNPSDVRAHRNRTDQPTVEIYSSSLLQQLHLCGCWEENRAYKMTGILVPQEGTVFFEMKEAVVIPIANTSRKD